MLTRERRLRAVLERLRSEQPGERMAALAALEKLIPQTTTLREVLEVGLFYLDQNAIDTSLLEEVERLRLIKRLSDQRVERQQQRIRELEMAARDALLVLKAASAQSKFRKN
ncbi:MAG: hypothetical protein P4M00_24470 [Azospirillaceae bacterium]|nr:hypothetical protein [Azospirillaceae bacterium]